MPQPSKLSAILAIALVAILLAPPSSQGTAQGQNFTEVTTNAASVPQYGTATLLMEDLGGGSIVELAPAHDNDQLYSFYILPEGDTYYLWLNSVTYPDYGIEQRLESEDGLVWHDRTNTNLEGPPGAYMRVEGLCTVIKDEGIYEGWEQYYYEWSYGWGHAHRYVTSTNGITWTVVNQPTLIGSVWANVIKVDDTYHMWAGVHFDPNYSDHPQPLRYRTSSSGGTGWGNWETGGETVTIDGEVLERRPYPLVRRLADGTYQLFYHISALPEIHLATSSDGVHFTTVISSLVNAEEVLPPSSAFQYLREFVVVDVKGEDWIYFVFQDQENVYHLAVSRPAYYTHLPLVLQDYPSNAFPLHIGDAIPTRSAAYQGETFYSTTLQIPNELPASGHFYLSSLPDAVAEALVDDKLAIVLTNDDIFVFNFSTSGYPEPAIVEIPRAVMEQMSGQTVTVEYRDVYGSLVGANAMWLIWIP
jgi:hypothetical protein